MTTLPSIPNGGAVALMDVPRLSVAEFRECVLHGVREGSRVAALFGYPEGSNTALTLCTVLASRETGRLSVFTSDVGDAYPSMTPECEQVHLFEREIAELWRVRPAGHPWLKPVRFQPPRRPGPDLWPEQSRPPACGVTRYFTIAGAETHEVAVGPVHAGIIEPGHFRFQCHGETVYHLEISLGYQHRGVERAVNGGLDKRTIHYLETLAGDTTVGHTLAHCRVLEALGKCRVPARAQVLRGVAEELERIANHVGDLGAMAGDIGFLPTQAYCGRIRGDVLNLTALLCGNRFGRGFVRPGGTGFDIDAGDAAAMRRRLDTILRDAQSAVNLLWEAPSVLARFEAVGAVPRHLAERVGLVGVAARACGIGCDVRQDYPCGIYRFAHIPVSTWETGDVFARAFVRWLEVQRAYAFLCEQLQALPDGPIQSVTGPLAPRSLAVALTEGWRGEICHVALTDADGGIAQYKIVDPSFHNWLGLACALRNQQISDFPLCNKSFNLSYCGHDL